MTFIPNEKAPKTAFGELSTSSLTPIVQLLFPHNINEEIIETRNNNGAITVDEARAKLSTGAAANQTAEFRSKIPVRYVPGQGAVCRFTRIWTTGVTGSSQGQGMGSSGDGLYFGYNGTSFGVLRRESGVPEVRTLTVSTASTTAENITITLDGDADATVAVTNSGDTTITANEIAAHDFSDLGRGWRASVSSDTVIFESYDASSRTGTYSLGGATTAVGSFAQTLAGSAATDNWTAQASWNIDPMDGTGPSGMTLDQTKGNIYQIKYQWLGYGQITFALEAPESGAFQAVHAIKYANSSTSVTFKNPTLPLSAFVSNTSNTSDIVGYTPSFAAFVEGALGNGHIHHGAVAAAAGIGTTETPILTILNKVVYQGGLNRSQIKLIFSSASIDGTKPATIRFRTNAILTGSSFSDISTNTSVAAKDSSSTAISGGNLQFAFGLSKADGKIIDLTEASFTLNPGDSLSVSVEASSGTTDVLCAFNWEEFL